MDLCEFARVAVCICFGSDIGRGFKPSLGHLSVLGML